MAKQKERADQLAEWREKVHEVLRQAAPMLGYRGMYELELSLSRELYLEAVDGFSRLIVALDGFRGDGEGI